MPVFPRSARVSGELAGPQKYVNQRRTKILFIRYYPKNYPTFDVQAATFGLSRSKVCEQAHHLARAFERTLRTLGVLPARAVDALAQMQAVFADVPVLLLDATERSHHRPQAAVDRKATAQRNHLTCCCLAWVSLRQHARQMGPTIYQAHQQQWAPYLRQLLQNHSSKHLCSRVRKS